MSRANILEGDQDPPRKPTKSNSPSPRASTLSQTIQVITNRFRLAKSPKLRRLSRKAPYDRAVVNQQEHHQDEEHVEETDSPPEDDSIETEVFFKKATTTSTLYQVNHSLDDTLPYIDPLLELRRDSLTPVTGFNVTPPSPFSTGYERQIITPPLIQVTNRQLEVVPGTSSDIIHATNNLVGNTVITEISQGSEEIHEIDNNTSEQPAQAELIDLHTEITPTQGATINLREGDLLADDWNASDIHVTEDDRDTPFTTAHNTIVIDDSDDAHSDSSTGSDEGNAGYTTPPPSPPITPQQVPTPKTPEKRRGFGNPPWAADQNTGQGGMNIPQPKATSSPKKPISKVKRAELVTMESQTQVKGKTHNSDIITNSKHVSQTQSANVTAEMTDEMALQGMLHDRQAALPALIKIMQSYPRLEQSTLDVVLMYYKATHNEFPLLELTRESRDLLLDTIERILTGFRGIPLQTLLLHSDLSILLYTYTVSEIAELYPMVARHMQPLYQVMSLEVEMHEGKPCRYNDVHDIIATSLPTKITGTIEG